MRDDLTLHLIWEDDDLLQVEMIGACPVAMARTQIYMTWDGLVELCDALDA